MFNHEETPGPGHYVAKVLQEKPVYSSFVSRTKLEKKAQDLGPGPGAYYRDPLATVTSQAPPPELQYFGSTVERFVEDDRAKEGPGPGSYGAPDPKRKQVSANRSFSQAVRFKAQSQKAPGPGQYQTVTEMSASSTSVLGATGSMAFGSTEARRTGVVSAQSGPGPGAYGTTTEQEDPESAANSKPANKTKPNAPSAVFKSETPQDALTRQIIREGLVGPPPGAYNPICAKDVAAVLRQPPKSEGFGSAQPRETKLVLPLEGPGPGWYKVNEITGGKKAGSFNRVMVEGVLDGGKVKALGFASQSQRFETQPSWKGAPGPGAYTHGPSWITRSHNIHFGDFA